MKRIFAIFFATLLALTMTVSAFAYEARDIMLCFGNSADWNTKYSEVVNVTESGEYTFKIEGLDYALANLTVIYLKESAVEAGETTEGAFPAGTQIITKSFKINGEESPLTEGYPTALNDAGVLDVCWYNIWATSYAPMDGIFDINSVEVTVEIILPEEGAEAPAEEEAPADEPAVETEEPEVEAEETPAETGLALSLIPAVVALAVVVLKRR